MKKVLEWMSSNYDKIVKDLETLVAIPSLSSKERTHQQEIEDCAEEVRNLMGKAGLENVTKLQTGEECNPFVYAEWLHAPGKPTVLLYSHYDVQPAGPASAWVTEAWKLTRRDSRMWGRGTVDDKGATAAHLAAVTGFLKTRGTLPVNVKMLVEGEEEIGSPNLLPFFEKHKELIHSDVIVVCDTENMDTRTPCITYSLRGIVEILVEVESAKGPRHSGTAGGFLADAAIALNVILSRLYWANGKLPIPGIDQGVVPMTEEQREWMKSLPGNEAAWRKELGVLDGVRFANRVHPYEQTWRQPAVTVIAQQAGSFSEKSNAVFHKAAALLSCRIAPNQDPDEVFGRLRDFLTKDPPWSVKVTVTQTSAVRPWMTNPRGPAFGAAKAAMQEGFGTEPVSIGCGGTIGFVGPLAELFGGAPALLLGIEDPMSNPHAPNESLDEGIFKKLMASLAYLFEKIGNLPGEKVK